MKKILGGVLLLPLLMLAGCKKSDPAPSKHTVKYFVLIITEGGTLKSGSATFLKDDYNALSEDMTKNLRTITAGSTFLWEKTVTLTGGTMADLEVNGVISGAKGRVELTIEIDGKNVSILPGISTVVANQTVIGGSIQWLVPK